MGNITVDIRYKEVVNWHPRAACSFNLPGYTDLWRINIGANISFIPRLVNLLEPEEVKRAGRYYQEKDRQRFVITRAALRIILSEYTNQAPAGIRFGTGPNKKPFLTNQDTGISYNTSHSDQWALIAVSKNVVGVDTEKIDPSFAYADILPDHFSEAEISFIEQQQPHYRFCLLWTRKEAITKLTGQGLDERLKTIPSLNHKHLVADNIINSFNDITLTSFELDNSNLATVAYETGNDAELRFWDMDFTSI